MRDIPVNSYFINFLNPGARQHEALHPGHRPGPLLSQQGQARQHCKGEHIQLGPARSQVRQDWHHCQEHIHQVQTGPLLRRQ